MSKKVEIKKGDLIVVQPYGDDPCVATVTRIKGNKIYADNGFGEVFENDADDCTFITEADAIAQGLL